MTRIFDRGPSSWKDLEALVAQAFAEMGYQVDQGASLQTARGVVAVDVVAINLKTPLPTKIICECKHWERSVSQHVIHGFRSVCADAGVHLGIIISRAGFQRGAEEKAQFTNVHLLTFDEFQSSYFSEWQAGMMMILTYMRDEILPIFRADFGLLEDGLDQVPRDLLVGVVPSTKYWLLWGTPVSQYFIQGAAFPMEVCDPRGDPSDLQEITINTHRQFYEVAKQGMIDARTAFGLPARHFDVVGNFAQEGPA